MGHVHHARGCGTDFGLACTCGPAAAENPHVAHSTGENETGEAMCCDGRTVVEHREANDGTCCVDRDGVALSHSHGPATGKNGAPMGAKTRTRDDLISDWYASETYKALVASAATTLGHAYELTTAEATERLGEEPYWALISQAERDEAAKSGAAMPDGSYPVKTCEGENSVDSAVSAVGRGGADHDAIRRHIIKRADSLGCSSKIPENWNGDGSLKSDSSTPGSPFAAPTPPPPAGDGKAKPSPAEPSQPAGDAPKADQPDAVVDEHLKALSDALDQAIAAEHADMQEDRETKSPVLNDLTKMREALDATIADQKTDETDEGAAPPPPPDAPTAAEKEPPKLENPKGGPKPAVRASMAAGDVPGNAEGVPGDADDSPPGPGDIEAATVCKNPNCGHAASAHEDLAEGENSGSCQMAGCECPGFVTGSPADQVVGPTDSAGAPAPQVAEEELSTEPFAGERFSDPPAAAGDAPPPATEEGSKLPPLDPDPNVALGPAFSIPVAWLEGVQTGDGRMIDPGALTWRTPPLPLMWLDTSPHDPSGMSGNDPARLVGRIEEISVEDGTGKASGHFLASGSWEAEKLEQMGRLGVSIDVGSAEVEIQGGLPIMEGPGPEMPIVIAEDGELEIPPIVEHLVKGEVMGITVCPFPAFAGAYIVLGDGSNLPDGPPPKPTPEQAQMGIRYVDSVACEPCSKREAGLVASGAGASTVSAVRDRKTVDGAGPVAPPRSWFEDPKFGPPDLDPRLRETIDARTGHPSGKFAAPITVTPDGEYYGHIAQWGVCHQGPQFISRGQCVMAPRSRTGYAWFHGRGSVLTAEGDVIDVGRVTADVGHASTSAAVTAAMAIAHYDNSGLCAAAVRAGEDDYGIWVHGAVHPAVSPEQVYSLRLCPPSGDWRPVGSGSELIAVLHVNEPGFPVARAHIEQDTGRVTSLVAAGVPLFELPRHEPTLEERVEAMERGFRPIARMAVNDAKARMAALRGGG